MNQTFPLITESRCKKNQIKKGDFFSKFLAHFFRTIWCFGWQSIFASAPVAVSQKPIRCGFLGFAILMLASLQGGCIPHCHCPPVIYSGVISAAGGDGCVPHVCRTPLYARRAVSPYSAPTAPNSAAFSWYPVHGRWCGRCSGVARAAWSPLIISLGMSGQALG